MSPEPIPISPGSVLIVDAAGELYAERLRARMGQDPFRVLCRWRTPTAAEAATVRALFIEAPALTPEMLAGLPSLSWIQALTAGIDPMRAHAPALRHVLVTSLSGVHGPQMAELALSMMLALQRRLPTMIENQRHRRWQRWPQPVLAGKTVTILGLGAAGRSLARACKALGMRVVGVSASQASAEDFDLVVPRARLTEVCAAADFLVLLAALEPETRRLVGAEVLAALPPHAFLINLGRGGLVDEAALIEALRTERLAGAGLDVFDEEPLPPEHPLWELPTVLLTPHIGGWSDVLIDQAVPLLAHNLGAFLSGRPGALRNLRRL